MQKCTLDYIERQTVHLLYWQQWHRDVISRNQLVQTDLVLTPRAPRSTDVHTDTTDTRKHISI